MRRAFSIIIVSLVCVEWPLFAAEEDMNFYKQEAEVVSASLRPQPAQQTPATVYVVTQQDIKDIGAITIPDALRNVPGVQVTQYRTGHLEVAIRGLGEPYSNRILVMMDGRTLLDGTFDHIGWESLPFTMDEIDRIEVVEGPASAVYGANAVSGVINIITKTPDQVQGGQTTFTGGERSTYQGSALYGKKDGPLGYRLNGGWRSANQMQNADSLATEAGMFNGLVNYDLSDHSGVSMSGGFNNFNTLDSLGVFGVVQNKGLVSYTRADAHYRDTRFRTFWNRGSLPDVTYNQYDVQADQSLELPFKNRLAFGASYRRNQATDISLNNGKPVHEDLWAAFFEDKWDFADRWMLMGSGRVDRHPFTPIRFSPRGSLLYTPVPEHVFRVSGGTSYRNPTLTENYTNVQTTVPFGQFGFDTIPLNVFGSQQLAPETMESVEISHEGNFQRVKTNITGFYYRYTNFIQATPNLDVSGLFSTPPTTPVVNTPWINTANPLHDIGGTFGGEVLANSWLRVFANYTVQYLRSNSGDTFESVATPRHQVNAGLRTKTGGMTTGWAVNWVDKTKGLSGIPGSGPTDPNHLLPVSAYFLVNAHVGYAFPGALNGLEVGVNAYNLLNHDHYQQLPAGVDPSSGSPYNGESAEIVRSRFTGTVTYKF